MYQNENISHFLIFHYFIYSITVDYFKAYAKISNLMRAKNYTFIIRSNNSVETSLDYSTVYIPPQTGRKYCIQLSFNIFFKHHRVLQV